MSDEQQRLMRAITKEPRNDTLRLICADWFEDQGKPGRAAYIRLACQTANLTEHFTHHRMDHYCAKCSSCRETTMQVKALSDKHATTWLREEFPLLANAAPNRDVLSVTWERGFPHTLRCEVGWWFKNHRLIEAVVPIQRLQLCGPLFVEFRTRQKSSEGLGGTLIEYDYRLYAMNRASVRYAWQWMLSEYEHPEQFLPLWARQFDDRNVQHYVELLASLWKRLEVSYEPLPTDLYAVSTDQMPRGWYEAALHRMRGDYTAKEPLR